MYVYSQPASPARLCTHGVKREKGCARAQVKASAQVPSCHRGQPQRRSPPLPQDGASQVEYRERGSIGGQGRHARLNPGLISLASQTIETLPHAVAHSPFRAPINNPQAAAGDRTSSSAPIYLLLSTAAPCAGDVSPERGRRGKVKACPPLSRTGLPISGAADPAVIIISISGRANEAPGVRTPYSSCKRWVCFPILCPPESVRENFGPGCWKQSGDEIHADVLLARGRNCARRDGRHIGLHAAVVGLNPKGRSYCVVHGSFMHSLVHYVLLEQQVHVSTVSTVVG